jgi:hypothetical protein
MHAGFEHRGPQYEADEQVGRYARDAAPVHRNEHQQSSAGDHERRDRRRAGVEQRDDDDRTEVVDDRQP